MFVIELIVFIRTVQMLESITKQFQTEPNNQAACVAVPDHPNEAVLDTPPHILSGSERNGRNPSGSEQIPSGMVGIRAESEWNGRNGRNLVGMTCQ